MSVEGGQYFKFASSAALNPGVRILRGPLAGTLRGPCGHAGTLTNLSYFAQNDFLLVIHTTPLCNWFYESRNTPYQTEALPHQYNLSYIVFSCTKATLDWILSMLNDGRVHGRQSQYQQEISDDKIKEKRPYYNKSTNLHLHIYKVIHK